MKIKEVSNKGLTPNKKKMLKSMQGIASSPIDFNVIRDNEKYGENEEKQEKQTNKK